MWKGLTLTSQQINLNINILSFVLRKDLMFEQLKF